MPNCTHHANHVVLSSRSFAYQFGGPDDRFGLRGCFGVPPLQMTFFSVQSDCFGLRNGRFRIQDGGLGVRKGRPGLGNSDENSRTQGKEIMLGVCYY